MIRMRFLLNLLKPMRLPADDMSQTDRLSHLQHKAVSDMKENTFMPLAPNSDPTI